MKDVICEFQNEKNAMQLYYFIKKVSCKYMILSLRYQVDIKVNEFTDSLSGFRL